MSKATTRKWPEPQHGSITSDVCGALSANQGNRQMLDVPSSSESQTTRSPFTNAHYLGWREAHHAPSEFSSKNRTM